MTKKSAVTAVAGVNVPEAVNVCICLPPEVVRVPPMNKGVADV
jgi:hypothetical protein